MVAGGTASGDREDGSAPSPSDCDGGDHSGCPHVPSVEPWRALTERSEPSGPLCGCVCHAECPLTGTGTLALWSQQCTCNGALRKRRALRRVDSQRAGSGDGTLRFDVGASLRKGVDDARRKRAARSNAAQRAKGQRAEQVATIIDDEWRRQGLEPPAGQVKQLWVDRLRDPPDLVERARAGARLGRDVLGLGFRLRRQGGLGRLVDRAGAGRAQVFEIATGSEYTGVRLDPEVEVVIERLVRGATFLPSFLRATITEVRAAGAEVEVWTCGEGVGAESGTRLGVIEPADDFRRLLRAAARVGQPCVVETVLFRVRGDHWQVAVGRPIQC